MIKGCLFKTGLLISFYQRLQVGFFDKNEQSILDVNFTLSNYVFALVQDDLCAWDFYYSFSFLFFFSFSFCVLSRCGRLTACNFIILNINIDSCRIQRQSWWQMASEQTRRAQPVVMRRSVHQNPLQR